MLDYILNCTQEIAKICMGGMMYILSKNTQGQLDIDWSKHIQLGTMREIFRVNIHVELVDRCTYVLTYALIFLNMCAYP